MTLSSAQNLGASVISRVALTKGGGRRENIEAALQLVGSDIDLKAKSNILIKPNFVSTTAQLTATHVDAVRAVLRFLRQRYDGRITIGESTNLPAWEGYERFGYLDLVKEYGIDLVDLNEGVWAVLDAYDSSLRPMKVRFSKQVAESDYRISVCPAKTHDVVIVTLSIKNLAMGSLRCQVEKGGARSATRGLLRRCYGLLPPSVRRSARLTRMRDTAGFYATGSDKRKMHQGYPVHNLNLYLLASACPPHLSVIDGYVAMEGNGPTDGDPIDWRIAIASQDPVAADCLAARLMGFDVSDIGYLWYCYRKGLGVGESSQMEILGADPQNCYRRFQPPPTYQAQRNWRDDKINNLLGI
jgi:uncharacterized protein (DUF362 family)